MSERLSDSVLAIIVKTGDSGMQAMAEELIERRLSDQRGAG